MVQPGDQFAAVSRQTDFGVTEGSVTYATTLLQLPRAHSFEYDNQLVGREGVEPPQLSRRFYRPPRNGVQTAESPG